jgi:hypothetical protein
MAIAFCPSRSSIGANFVVPALLIKASIRPNALTVASAVARQASSRATSPHTAKALVPRATHCRTVLSASEVLAARGWRCVINYSRSAYSTPPSTRHRKKNCHSRLAHLSTKRGRLIQRLWPSWPARPRGSFGRHRSRLLYRPPGSRPQFRPCWYLVNSARQSAKSTLIERSHRDRKRRRARGTAPRGCERHRRRTQKASRPLLCA